MANQVMFSFGGIDYTKYVDIDSVNFTNDMVMTSDTGSVIIQLDGELPRPMCGQIFLWTQINSATLVEVPNAREFGGVVVTVQEDTEGNSLLYTVTVKSFDHWLNRMLVVNWYNQYYVSGTKAQLLAAVPGDSANINNTATNGNGDGIINRIIEQYCPGFTCNNVQCVPNQIVPQYFNYSTVTNAITTIANQLEMGYYVDYYKDVHFYSFEYFPSPLPGNTLYADTDLTSYGDLEIIEDGQQTYNQIYLKGFKTRNPVAMKLSFVCDGNTSQWSLGYRVSSAKGDIAVGIFPSITAYLLDTTFQTTGVVTYAGATQATIARDIVDGAPNQGSASNTAYVQYTQYLVRLPNYNGTNQPPTNGMAIGVFFHYLQDTVYMGQDLAAQRALAAIEGTSGIYQYSVDDKSLTNSTLGAPQAKAQLMLQKYARPQISGSFISYLPGWRAGQCFQLVTNKRFGGINQTMYVQENVKTMINNVNGTYLTQNTITFANSPYLV